MKKAIMCLALALMTNYVTADTVTLKGTSGKVDLSLGGVLATTNNVGGAAFDYPSATASPTYTYYVDSDASSSASNTLWDLDLGRDQIYYLINGKNYRIYAASITNSATGTIRIRSNSNGNSPLYLYTTGSIYLTSLVSDFEHINGKTANVTINSGSSVTITDEITTKINYGESRSYKSAGSITNTADTGDITISNILTSCFVGGNTDNIFGGNIALTAQQGDVVVSGQIDALGTSSAGTLTISATNGAITLANLDVRLVKDISLKALKGAEVSIANLITGLTVDNVNGKVTGPFLVTTTSNNITYHSALQTTLGLKGNYNIYKLNGTTDVGYDLIDLDPELAVVDDVGLSGSVGTTSPDVVALLNVPMPAGANYLEIFYDTTDHTNQAALWQPRTVVGSYSSVANLLVTNTVTATALAPNTTYYYRFALSNEVTGVRTWQRQASRAFVTDGPASTVKLIQQANLNSPTAAGVITTTNELLYASYVYSRDPAQSVNDVKYFVDVSAVIMSSNKLWNLDLGAYDIYYGCASDYLGQRDVTLYAASVTSTVGKISIRAESGHYLRTFSLTTTGSIDLPEILSAAGHDNSYNANVIVRGSAVTISNRVKTKREITSTRGFDAGDITITATTGAITVKDLQSGNYLDTGAGADGGDVTLSATIGNVVVTGEIDAGAKIAANNGNLTITAGGDITLSSLSVTNLKNIAFSSGGKITVSGAIVGLTVAGSTVSLPNGSFTLNKDIYYYPKQNAGVLTGNYLIYNGATDTGRKLISAVPVGTMIRFF